MNNFISCERKNKMPKIECVVLNEAKTLVRFVILNGVKNLDLLLRDLYPCTRRNCGTAE